MLLTEKVVQIFQTQIADFFLESLYTEKFVIECFTNFFSHILSRDAYML